MYERILVRYGDLTLKGKNKRMFVRMVNQLVKEKVNSPLVKYERQHDRLYILLNGEDHEKVIKGLNRVSGLSSYSLVHKCDRDIETVCEQALEIMKEEKYETGTTFKVEVKRADKAYPITSPDITQKVAKHVLKNVDGLIVDVHKPKLTLNVEVRLDGAYIYAHKIKGMGGYPVGVGGKGLVLLSGGIDSPVASYLAMKQGIEVELFHFESTPLTSIESAQKVIDLAKKVSVFAPRNRIKLHLVPFEPIHQKLLSHVDESYIITIMRRMMYRIAEKYAQDHRIMAIINGDSVGQVASQTLESMTVINNVVRIPILRPLLIFDKLDIIDISKKIKCYDISVQPFEDCCTVYVPKAPATRPKEKYCLREEANFDYEPLVAQAVENIKTLVLDESTDINLPMLGFTVQEAL